MGIDCPDIRRIIHWGPAPDYESYLQETGRGGRDGRQSFAVLYYARTEFSTLAIIEKMSTARTQRSAAAKFSWRTLIMLRNMLV